MLGRLADHVHHVVHGDVAEEQAVLVHHWGREQVVLLGPDHRKHRVEIDALRTALTREGVQ